VVAFPERECSVQRRNQKVIEESPSCLIDPVTRAAMHEQARMLCKAVNYRSAGTIEMLCDGKKNFYFLEMNTRLQVEHPVTELVSGEDLVEHMLWVGAGRPLPQKFIDNPSAPINGWAIESRVYAEDPIRRFLPSIGPLSTYKEPQTFVENGLTVRLDTGVYEGGEISMFYDPMIAKLCTHAPDRATAIRLQEDALDRYVVRGLGNNITFLRACYRNPKFREGDYGTGFIPQQFPHGYHGTELTADETAELISYAAMIHRSRNMLRTSELAEATSEDMSTFVVVLGGPKGQAYQVSFNDDFSSESVQVKIQRLPDAADAKSKKPAADNLKHYHRGTKAPCEVGESTDVVLNGMTWQVESDLAEFSVEVDKTKLSGAAPTSTRAAAASAEESDILSEKEEVCRVTYALIFFHLLSVRLTVRSLLPLLRWCNTRASPRPDTCCATRAATR
jgi:acetyl/propionyl-CoA carboxylase alpha subunit